MPSPVGTSEESLRSIATPISPALHFFLSERHGLAGGAANKHYCVEFAPILVVLSQCGSVEHGHYCPTMLTIPHTAL